MAYQVQVTPRDGGQDIFSPSLEKEEAERQLALIRGTLGSSEAPDLPWLAVQGRDILGASVIGG